MRKTVSLFNDEDKKKVVTIADREADIYDMFLLADRINTNVLIRASYNRKINRTAIHSDISGEYLWDFIKKQKSKGIIKVKVPKKDNQPEHMATCEIKFSKINIFPPRNRKGSKEGNLNLGLYAIHVIEKNPQKSTPQIEWMLLTNIPVINYKEAVEKIKWYCLRWRIEVYFKVIKSGFKVEDCRLENADRLIRYLAVISIIAWRVYWLTLVSRTSPNLSSLIFLNEFDWKILFVKFNSNKKIPKCPPSMKQITIWIAQLGGF